MSAVLDVRLIETPLLHLSAVEIPMAILLRRRSGELDETEAIHASIAGLFACLSVTLKTGRGHELVMFINAMADTIAPERRIQQPAVDVRSVPDLYDENNQLLFVLGEDGYPVADGNGLLMTLSLKELNQLFVLADVTCGARAH